MCVILSKEPLSLRKKKGEFNIVIQQSKKVIKKFCFQLKNIKILTVLFLPSDNKSHIKKETVQGENLKFRVNHKISPIFPFFVKKKNRKKRKNFRKVDIFCFKELRFYLLKFHNLKVSNKTKKV